MRKTIISVVLAAFCILALTGCAVKETPDYTQMREAAYSFLELCETSAEETLTYADNTRDEYLELMLTEANIPCTGDAYKSILAAWIGAEEEMGSFLELNGDFVFKEQSGEIIATAEAAFEKRNADLIFTFDTDGDVKALSVGAQYSKKEILKKAAQNTLIGMGVVFSVLIFIAVIIWLMGLALRGVGKKTPSQESDLQESDLQKPEQLKDDLSCNENELIAVITAAVSAYRAAEEETTDGFVVRSVKRRSNNNWNRA